MRPQKVPDIASILNLKPGPEHIANHILLVKQQAPLLQESLILIATHERDRLTEHFLWILNLGQNPFKMHKNFLWHSF